MTSVGWNPSYDIDIKHLDVDSVHHLGQAIKDYLDKMKTQQHTDALHDLEKILETCDIIVTIDEED